MLTFAVLLLAFVIGALVMVLVAGGRIDERRRLALLLAELRSSQEIDELTRTAIKAMRYAARTTSRRA
jgi:hypothetical protein